MQAVASTTNVGSLDSFTAMENPHPVALVSEEHQGSPTARAPRGKSKSRKGPLPVQTEFPNGISPIHPSRQGAAGVGTIGSSTQEAISVEQYEEQRKRRNERRLEEDYRMFEQFRQER